MKKENEFLRALSDIDESIIAEAAAVRDTKPKANRLAFFIAAACLTVILLAIPLGILIANRSETPRVPTVTTNKPPYNILTTSYIQTTQAPTTTEKPKASLLDIPGALSFEENKQNFTTTVGDAFGSSKTWKFTQDEVVKWAKRVKQENDAVIGYIKSYTSVLIPEGKDYYRVSTMEIAVLEDISGIGCQTVTAVYANRYTNKGSYQPTSQYYIGNGVYKDEIKENLSVQNDMFADALRWTEVYLDTSHESPIGAALLLLKKADGQNLTVGESTYALSNYADYVLDACFAYDFTNDSAALHSFYRTILLQFKPSLLKEVLHNSLATQGDFRIVDGNPNPTLKFNTYHDSRGNIFPAYTSIFFDELFLQDEKTGKYKSNPDTRWVVTIEGVAYEIKIINLFSSSVPCISLDLGKEFSLDLLDFDENGSHTFNELRLDVYRDDGSLICYHDFAKDGYTYTKPKPEPAPEPNYDPINLLNDPEKACILSVNGALCSFENACAAFDGNSAFKIHMKKDSPIFGYLFENTYDVFGNRTGYEPRIVYRWVITVDGVTYEVERLSVKEESFSKCIYLDLGPDFAFDSKHAYSEIKLDIYYNAKHLYYYANFGSYIHTKIE